MIAVAGRQRLFLLLLMSGAPCLLFLFRSP